MFNSWTLRESEANPMDADDWWSCGGDNAICGGFDDDGADIGGGRGGAGGRTTRAEGANRPPTGAASHGHHRQSSTSYTGSRNEVATALQAHAQSKRQAMMIARDRSSAPRSLDMAGRLSQSFTRFPSFLGGTAATCAATTARTPASGLPAEQRNLAPHGMINKKDSILSIHTDTSSSSGGSVHSTQLELVHDERRDREGRRNRCASGTCWLWVCISITVLLLAAGIGVGVSVSRSKNGNNGNVSSASVSSNSGSNGNGNADSDYNIEDVDNEDLNTDGSLPSSPQIPGGDIAKPGGGDENNNVEEESSFAEDDWFAPVVPPVASPEMGLAPTLDTAAPPTSSPWIPVEPEVSLTASPAAFDADVATEENYDYLSSSNYLVGVYYYPWHGDDNFHNNDGYLRNQLIPSHQPELGEYKDSDPLVIAQHMRWFRQANIGLLVTSWWGPGRMTDTTTKDVILPHDDLGNLQIALHYETTGRIKSEDMTTVRDDMQYICENYFDHPNYYKIEGRPVLVIYVSRALHRDGRLEEALLVMRSEISKCGHSIYLIGDQVFQKAPNEDEPFIPFWYFDAVTNYDVYGSAQQPSPYALRERVDDFYSEQEKWRQMALRENCRFIPPVSPGYNDRAVRLEADHPPLSRRLEANMQEGSLFWYQLKKALPLVDSQVDNLVLVNSFNEWHEDTQIEPAIGEAASEPAILTGGLTYIGYGDLYLDILKAATTEGQEDFFDFLLA